MTEPFSPEELSVLREAQKRGALSEAQKNEIIRRMSEVEAIGPEQPPPPKRDTGPELEGPENPEEFAIVDRRAESLAELTGGFVSRPSLTAAGGMAGAAVAMPGAPLLGPFAPTAPLAGGAVGAAAGSNTYDAINNFLVERGVLKGSSLTMGEVIENATNEAYWDLMFGGGASLFRPILGSRRIIGKISGVFSREADQLINIARDKGIELGMADVGGSVPKGFLKTVSVFPFAATPAAKAQVTKQRQIVESVDRILNDLAPNASVATDLGVDLAKAAKRTNKEFLRVSGLLYDRFRDLAKGASKKDIIPTEKVVASAKELFGEIEEGAIKVGKGNRARQLKAPKPDALASFEQYIGDLQELPENITIQQYRRLTQELNDIYAALETAGVDVRRSGILKRALEEDLNNIRVDLLPDEEARAVKDALDTANKWYSKGLVGFADEVNVPKGFKGKPTFETATAKKFSRADKKFFGSGFAAGSINEDELYSVAVNLKSPEAVADLRALVGDDAMRSVARRHLETAVEKSMVATKIGSIEETVIDPAAFEKTLGLSGKTKEGLGQLLKIGGYDIADVKQLVKVMKSVEALGDPSTFVKRRAILGGARGVATAALGFGGAAAGGAAFAGGTGAVGATITIGTITLLTRHFSKIFSDPKALKNVLEALDTARATTARQAAVGRIIKFVGEAPEDNLPEGP